MTPERRRGRRPKSSGDTRTEIISAARTQFARDGLDRTSLRQIARVAGVDPALILHYFDSKEELFFEAIREGVFQRFETVLKGKQTLPEMGSQLVDAFLTLWDAEEHRSTLVALIRAGISNERVGRRLREFFRLEIPTKASERLEAGTAELRVGLVASQLLGLAIARYVVRIESVARANRAELIAAIGPTVTRYLAQPVERPGAG